MSEPQQPVSVRAFHSATLMYDGRGTRPRLEDFTHLDVAAESATPAQPVPAGPVTPAAPASAVAAGWDVAAFDALPAETRAAVMAGTAHGIGRGVLELEAQQLLVRPEDVHLHLRDPAKYVDAHGVVDRDAIRADLQALTSQRPELSRFGTGPGQGPLTDDGRLRAAPGALIGQQPDHTGGLAGRVAAAADVMNNPRRYGG